MRVTHLLELSDLSLLLLTGLGVRLPLLEESLGDEHVVGRGNGAVWNKSKDSERSVDGSSKGKMSHQHRIRPSSQPVSVTTEEPMSSSFIQGRSTSRVRRLTWYKEPKLMNGGADDSTGSWTGL